MRSQRGRFGATGCLLAVGWMMTACGSGTVQSGAIVPSTTRNVTTATVTTTTTPTSATPTTTTNVSSPPTLGVAVPARCLGCGQVEPSQVNVLAYALPGHVFPGVDFTSVQWQSWGAPRATATSNGFFRGPGESGTETLIAFDLGTCNGTYAYRAFEWTGTGRSQTFDPTNYFDACTGHEVGQGW